MVYFENLVFRFSQGLQIVEGVAWSVHVTRQQMGKRKGLRRMLLKDRARLRLAIIGRIMESVWNCGTRCDCAAAVSGRGQQNVEMTTNNQLTATMYK